MVIVAGYFRRLRPKSDESILLRLEGSRAESWISEYTATSRSHYCLQPPSILRHADAQGMVTTSAGGKRVYNVLRLSTFLISSTSFIIQYRVSASASLHYHTIINYIVSQYEDLILLMPGFGQLVCFRCPSS